MSLIRQSVIVEKFRRLLEQSKKAYDIGIYFQKVQVTGKGWPTADFNKDLASGAIEITDDITLTYGGVWSGFHGRYVDDSQNPKRIYVNPGQFDIIQDLHEIIHVSGARGSGKSWGVSLRALKELFERPKQIGRVVAPILYQTRAIQRAIRTNLANDWVVQETVRDASITLITGSYIDYKTCQFPHRLRSESLQWAIIDEAQATNPEVVEIMLPCLRSSVSPMMMLALTPSIAAVPIFLQMRNQEHASMIRMTYKENPFINRRVFEDLVVKNMDSVRAMAELDADWHRLIEEYEQSGDSPGFPCFDKSIHVLSTIPRSWEDITAFIAHRKTGHTGMQWICGVDQNWDWPNYAVIFKVYINKSDPLERKIWVAHAAIGSKGHCRQLMVEVKNIGYNLAEVLVIPDASSRWKRKQGQRGAFELIRSTGARIVAPKTNPNVLDSLNQINARFKPADGSPPRLFVVKAGGKKNGNIGYLTDALQDVKISKNDSHLDKSEGLDHVCDALRYPINYIEPITARMFTRPQSVDAEDS